MVTRAGPFCALFLPRTGIKTKAACQQCNAWCLLCRDNLDGDHLLDTGRCWAGHRSPCFGVRVATWGGQLAVTVTRHTLGCFVSRGNNTQIDGRLASRHSLLDTDCRVELAVPLHCHTTSQSYRVWNHYGLRITSMYSNTYKYKCYIHFKHLIYRVFV